MDDSARVYDAVFLDRNLELARAAAAKVLPPIFRLARVRSVVDVGCGRGGWLEQAAALGATALTGFDGPWCAPPDGAEPAFRFETVDLEQPVDVPPCDLAICLEVVEHLSPDGGQALVRGLCRAAPIVLFSAAQPGQGGPGHVNERPLSHWVRQFEGRGHVAYDIVRPRLWDDPAVAWWIRQNTLLFQSADRPVVPAARLRDLEGPVYDVVHPEALRRARAAR